MKKKKIRQRISEIIDQLSNGETTSHLAEEIRKYFGKTTKKTNNKDNNTSTDKN